MRLLATSLVLVAVATSAAAASPDPGAEAPAPAAELATSSASPASAPAAAGLADRGSSTVVPTQAVIDKLGQGDRLLLAGDHRGALFAYQDAVYAQPSYAPARVRLGRAYLALRYPDLAIDQAEAALAEDPGSADARKLLEDARAAPPRPGAAAAAGAPSRAAAAPAQPAARVFKLTPEPVAQPARSSATAAAAAGGAAASSGAAGAAAGGVAPVVAAAPAAGARGDAAAPAPSPAAQKEVAAQHYRTALGFLRSREWAKAVAALSDAILADPALAVAYSARGSAQFALGKYRDAAEDYSAATRLEPRLGTPIYGLAECYRVLGDGTKAAELYDRYARSTAADVRDDLRAIAVRRARELR